MGLSISQIKALVGEMQSELVDGRIRGVDQPQPWRIVFEIEKNGVRRYLLFSAHKQYARCHLVTKKEPNPKTPPRFCQLLRAHLRYKTLISLEHMQSDRIVRLRTAWTRGEAASEISLIAELTGSHANLFLVNAEDVVFGALYASKNRRLPIGSAYRAPEIKLRPSFRETEIPRVGTLNTSVDHFFRNLEEKEAEASAKHLLLSRYRQEIQKNKNRLSRFALRLSEAEAAERMLDRAEFLKAHLHEIEAGSTQFKYVDPKDRAGKSIGVPLDPALSPSENMALFFKKYKQSGQAKTALLAAIEKIRRTIDRLQVESKTVEAGGLPPLTALPPEAAPKQESKKREKAGPPSYWSTDDIELIVGRNASENARVTFEIARGNDLWFHASGVPGSHLIVRMLRGKEIPYQTLLDAATLALHFSASKNERKGEVIYTYKKYLRKVKGGKPGTVICSQEKAFYIAVEADRLERLLRSRRGTPLSAKAI